MGKPVLENEQATEENVNTLFEQIILKHAEATANIISIIQKITCSDYPLPHGHEYHDPICSISERLGRSLMIDNAQTNQSYRTFPMQHQSTDIGNYTQGPDQMNGSGIGMHNYNVIYSGQEDTIRTFGIVSQSGIYRGHTESFQISPAECRNSFELNMFGTMSGAPFQGQTLFESIQVETQASIEPIYVAAHRQTYPGRQSQTIYPSGIFLMHHQSNDMGNYTQGPDQTNGSGIGMYNYNDIYSGQEDTIGTFGIVSLNENYGGPRNSSQISPAEGRNSFEPYMFDTQSGPPTQGQTLFESLHAKVQASMEAVYAAAHRQTYPDRQSQYIYPSGIFPMQHQSKGTGNYTQGPDQINGPGIGMYNYNDMYSGQEDTIGTFGTEGQNGNYGGPRNSSQIGPAEGMNSFEPYMFDTQSGPPIQGQTLFESLHAKEQASMEAVYAAAHRQTYPERQSQTIYPSDIQQEDVESMKGNENKAPVGNNHNQLISYEQANIDEGAKGDDGFGRESSAQESSENEEGEDTDDNDTEEPWSNFGRPEGCKTTALAIEAKAAALKSVCRIRFKQLFGTGFRVGSKYVMTAAHVLKEICDKGKTLIPQQNKEGVLDNTFAEFDYFEPNAPKLTFKFKRDVFFNDKLDVAILELQDRESENVPMRPPFTKFEAADSKSIFHFIGHCDGNVMEIDENVQLLKKKDKKKFCDTVIEKSKRLGIEFNWIDVIQKRNGKKINHHHFHTSFAKGASGSPGVVFLDNGITYVVIMLTRGYPRWYYESNCDKATKQEWDVKYCIEEGVSIKAVYRKLKADNPELCQDIFEHDSYVG